jgi:excisionase family DNA binding protein
MYSLLTPNQVAEVLGVKLSTIYQWTHEGYIPHVKIGRLVRFDLRVIERWLEKLTKTGRTTKGLNLKDLGL